VVLLLLCGRAALVGYSVRMDCMCWTDNFIGDRYICDRTDPHPDDYGDDREGHHWVPATDEQWAERMAATKAAWSALQQGEQPPG
jgi:hypothetical protein